MNLEIFQIWCKCMANQNRGKPVIGVQLIENWTDEFETAVQNSPSYLSEPPEEKIEFGNLLNLV